MKSFQSHFCEAHGYAPTKFAEKVFYRCAYPHAALLAPFLGGIDGKFFAPDRDLITGAGRATTLAHVREEVGDYLSDSRNRSWLRQRLRLRVSTTRVIRLARQHFGNSAAPKPVEPQRH